MTIKIASVSQKGGVGKSSLTRMLAREYANAGWNVKIADMDIQQGTSFHWCRERAANNVEPAIRAETFASVAQALKDANNFDLFLMDGAPAASAATRDMAKAADLVLLPTGLSNDDLRPQILLAHELVKTGIKPNKMFFVLWRVGDSAIEIRDARDYIAQAGYRVLGGEVPDSTAYRRASDRGRAFTETSHKTLNVRADLVAQSIVDALAKQKRSAA